MVILLVAGHEPKQYVAGHKIVNARIGLARKPGPNRAPSPCYVTALVPTGWMPGIRAIYYIPGVPTYHPAPSRPCSGLQARSRGIPGPLPDPGCSLQGMRPIKSDPHRTGPRVFQARSNGSTTVALRLNHRWAAGEARHRGCREGPWGTLLHLSLIHI